MRGGLALLTISLAACGNMGEPPKENHAERAATPASTAQPAAMQRAPTSDELSCTGPFDQRDTFKSIEQRFGRDAARETISGPEGEDYEALVLWPTDPARRIELTAKEGSDGTIGSATVKAGSRWRIDGIGPGTGLAELARANGAPFLFYGFEWDYGGLVSDWRGGTFANRSDGCFLAVQLATREGADLPSSVIGDGEISSDLPALAGLGVTVGRITLSYPE